MSQAKLAPAASPLSRAERTIIENDVAKLAYFRNVGDYRKTIYLKSLAGHTVRLFAEVLRLDAEVEELSSARHEAVEALEKAVGLGVKLKEVLEKIRGARASGYTTGEAMSKIECWAREALEEQPAPMCKDPVSDERREA